MRQWMFAAALPLALAALRVALLAVAAVGHGSFVTGARTVFTTETWKLDAIGGKGTITMTQGALGHTGAIALIGEEPVAPYQRPPLSKGYLLGETSLERLYLGHTSIGDEALDHLAKLPSLKTLALNSTTVSDAGLDARLVGAAG